MRIGIGADHHRFLESELNESGLPLTLGGCIIPEQKLSFKANSDGDVILHALCNALSTALGGGSLSLKTEEMCHEQEIRESRYYVEVFLDEVRAAGYRITNISVSVEAKRPKLERHRMAITKRMAEICKVNEEQIGIAFTTGEGLTACGSGEGMMAQVIVLLEKV